MDTKGLRVEVKNVDEGVVTAVFSTFNAIDSDGDVTLPGAFRDGAEVRISAYGHTTWQGALPVGKGVIRATPGEAILDGQFFLNTTAGRDTFEVVEQMGAMQEWSYGFDVEEFEPGEYAGKQVRFLKQLTVHEVSPVLLGAGVNTRTLVAKSATSMAVPVQAVRKGAIGSRDAPTVSRSWDGPAVVAAITDDVTPSGLRSVFAWVDPDGDPEAKGSYKFPHHDGVGGPANVRACLVGIAALNGGRGGVDLSDSDRKAVYEHLASHLRDDDREPPELRAAPGGPLKFNDELLEGLAGVSSLIDSASRVVALRAEKGKKLSVVNAEILGWIADDLKHLEALLNPQPAGEVSAEELASTWLASLARVHNL